MIADMQNTVMKLNRIVIPDAYIIEDLNDSRKPDDSLHFPSREEYGAEKLPGNSNSNPDIEKEKESVIIIDL